MKTNIKLKESCQKYYEELVKYSKSKDFKNSIDGKERDCIRVEISSLKSLLGAMEKREKLLNKKTNNQKPKSQNTNTNKKSENKFLTLAADYNKIVKIMDSLNSEKKLVKNDREDYVEYYDPVHSEDVIAIYKSGCKNEEEKNIIIIIYGYDNSVKSLEEAERILKHGYNQFRSSFMTGDKYKDIIQRLPEPDRAAVEGVKIGTTEYSYYDEEKFEEAKRLLEDNNIEFEADNLIEDMNPKRNGETYYELIFSDTY